MVCAKQNTKQLWCFVDVQLLELNWARNPRNVTKIICSTCKYLQGLVLTHDWVRIQSICRSSEASRKSLLNRGDVLHTRTTNLCSWSTVLQTGSSHNGLHTLTSTWGTPTFYFPPTRSNEITRNSRIFVIFCATESGRTSFSSQGNCQDISKNEF